jgi:hypothetical protein
MKAGSTAASLKRRGQVKNGAIPAHQNPKISSPHTCEESDADAILGSPRPTCCRAIHIQGDHSHQCLMYQYQFPYELSETSRRIRTSWTAQYWCHIAACQRQRRSGTFEWLPHPSYPRDLAPCTDHFLGSLKEAPGGKTFRSDEEVQEAVRVATHAVKRFLSLGIQALVKCWRICIERNRGYLEEWQSCTEPICTKLAGKQILKCSLDSPTQSVKWSMCQKISVDIIKYWTCFFKKWWLRLESVTEYILFVSCISRYTLNCSLFSTSNQNMSLLKGDPDAKT